MKVKNYKGENDDEGCGHKSNEECMFCTECGKCRESLNSADVCSDCVKEKKYLVEVHFQSWIGNDCHKSIIVFAKDEEQAFTLAIAKARKLKHFKSCYHADCVEYQD